MSLIVTFVNVKSLIKKNIAFYMNVDIFQEDQHKLRAHVCVKNNENDNDCLKLFD